MLKSNYIAPMYEWMMLVKYGGINPASCDPLLLLKAADIMVGGRYLINDGRKKFT